MPKFSVIVPIYNVEKYLTRCLDSILGQDFVDYEVILVNDGATDHSRDLAEKYTSDDRFWVLDKPNGGLSDARNAGINKAHGEYIYLLDSDDWISPHLMSHVNKLLMANNVDMIFFDFFLTRDTKKFSQEHWFSNRPQGIREPEIALTELFDNRIGSFAWSYVCKKKLYEQRKIEFPVGRSYEDLGTTYRLINSADRIYFSSKPLYYYFQSNPKSITKTWEVKNYYDCLSTYSEMEHFLRKEYPENGNLLQKLDNQKFETLIMHLELSRGTATYRKIWRQIKALHSSQRFTLKRSNQIKYHLLILHLYWLTKTLKQKVVGQ